MTKEQLKTICWAVIILNGLVGPVIKLVIGYENVPSILVGPRMVLALLCGAVLVWLYWSPERQGQSCWVYCPGCKHELTSDNDSFVDDHEIFGVTYICTQCGTMSRWDFDAPVPLLRESESKAE